MSTESRQHPPGPHKPTFIYVGADKAGSTWIYRILDLHPQVFVPTVKDLFFFDRYYQHGWSWYARHFKDAPDTARAIGELSHDYLYSPEALERIARDLPGVQILVSLREPVERLVSHYWYMRRIGRTNLPFADALSAFPEIEHNSRYAEPLKHLFRLFPREQVHVLLFDDLKADPAAFGRQLCEAVAVDFDATLPYSEKVLERSSTRNPALFWALRQVGWGLRAVGFATIVGAVKYHPLFKKLFFKPSAAKETEGGPSAEHLAQLHADFRQTIDEVEGLLGRKLDTWRSAKSGKTEQAAA